MLWLPLILSIKDVGKFYKILTLPPLCQQFLTASSAHAVLQASLLLFALDVCENSVQNEGKLKHIDKTGWQNMLTKHVDKICWQSMLRNYVEKLCWEIMLTN